ncbi:MAG: TetR/AcrR family transcriptional regulator [Actinomycetota bacterium]|nr:TetR/AcrR family transcriptional regulator [Actinomycetota bacterium]
MPEPGTGAPPASSATAPPAARRRGRPRDARADGAILDATVELLGRVGYSSLRIDDVATNAGVSKTTIYRRWPSKVALVVATLGEFKLAHVPMHFTGDIAADLESILVNQYASLDGSPFGHALPGLVAEKHADPALAEAVDALWVDRRARLERVLAEAVAAGQLRADADLDVLVDLIAGPGYYRLLVAGGGLDPSKAVRYVRAILDGASPT